MTQAYTSTATVKTFMGLGGTADDTLLGTFATWTNEQMESRLGAPIGPDGTATRTFDSDGRDRLWVPHGIQSAGTLSIADETNGTYTDLASTDWVIRPLAHERKPGWPGQWVQIVDGSYVGAVPVGFGIWKFTGGVWGWAAIPGDLTMVATTVVVKLYQRRQTGQADVVGSDEYGNALISALLSPEDRRIIDSYRDSVHTGWVG